MRIKGARGFVGSCSDKHHMSDTVGAKQETDLFTDAQVIGESSCFVEDGHVSAEVVEVAESALGIGVSIEVAGGIDGSSEEKSFCWAVDTPSGIGLNGLEFFVGLRKEREHRDVGLFLGLEEEVVSEEAIDGGGGCEGGAGALFVGSDDSGGSGFTRFGWGGRQTRAVGWLAGWSEDYGYLLDDLDIDHDFGESAFCGGYGFARTVLGAGWGGFLWRGGSSGRDGCDDPLESGGVFVYFGLFGVGGRIGGGDPTLGLVGGVVCIGREGA